MADKYGFDTTAEQIASDQAAHIRGRTFIVTGPTWGGMGAEMVRVLVKHDPELVVLAGRTQASLDETITKIKKETPEAKVRSLILDLASLKSVRAAAAEVNAYNEDVDVLINNAGIMACPYSTTEDGFEMQFGVNHLGHFLFTNLILDKMLKTKHPRIVNITSTAHRVAPVIFDDPGFSNGAKYERWISYGQAKTANVLFSRELNVRYGSKGLVAIAAHPGGVITNLIRYLEPSAAVKKPILDYWGNDPYGDYIKTMKLKKIENGAATPLAAALVPEMANNGGAYIADCQVDEDQCWPHAKSLEDAAKLWELSEQLVGQKF